MGQRETSEQSTSRRQEGLSPAPQCISRHSMNRKLDYLLDLQAGQHCFINPGKGKQKKRIYTGAGKATTMEKGARSRAYTITWFSGDPCDSKEPRRLKEQESDPRQGRSDDLADDQVQY